jgi:alcohol dehydrogenase
MQQIIQGEGSLNKISSLALLTRHTSVFVVAGNHFREQHTVDFLKGIQADWFIKSGQNVNKKEIAVALEQFKKSQYSVILAIGGGSVIDLAKAIIYECIGSSLTVPAFIAAPTTAGSGSEATHFAVIYDNKKKLSLAHPALLPSNIILDAELTYSLSPAQTAASGMDVFSQAVESYWNVRASEESKSYARESIEIWGQYFIEAVNKPLAISRERMLTAAYLAGKAINITRTTGPHALSYYLTAEHGIIHGQAVGIFLPVFFLYNAPCQDLCRILNVKDEEEAMQYITGKMKQAGLKTNFAELGLAKDEIIDDLLNSVNKERFDNNPQPFDKARLKQLFLKYL